MSIKKYIQDEIREYVSIAKIARKINKKPIILKYVMNFAISGLAIYFGVDLNTKFYSYLGEKNNQYVNIFLMMMVLNVVTQIYSFVESYYTSIIRKDIFLHTKNHIFELLLKVRNLFFETYKENIDMNTLCSYYAEHVYHKMFEIPNKIITYISFISKIVILLRINFLMTCLFVLLTFTFERLSNVLGDFKWNTRENDWKSISCINTGIYKRIVNHSIFSIPNIMDQIKPLIKDSSGYEKKTIHDYMRLILHIFTIISDYLIVSMTEPIFVLFWYTSKGDISSTISCITFSGKPCHIGEFKNFNKIESHMKIVGDKHPQIQISPKYLITIEKSAAPSLKYNIADDIKIEPGKTILIDGKTEMGKTLFYKIMMSLVDFQPPVILCQDDSKTKIPFGFEQFCGQIKYVSPISDKMLIDGHIEDISLWENIGIFRDIKLSKLALKLAHIKNDSESIVKNPSSGMQKRILLAKNLPIEEQYIPVLILDEPDNGVDYDTGLEIINGIIEWYHSTHKGCIFLTTHQKALKDKIKFDAIYEADNMIIRKIK
jgi:ABC-type transport system involved in cytochrome c biogenesis ATPase subunit